MGRVTINPGLRFERFVMSIPAQSAGGRHAGCRRASSRSRRTSSTGTALSPRFGFAWDLFGDGSTALKGGVSRYDRLAGVNLVQPLNLRNIAFQTCPWPDAQQRSARAE